MSPRRRREYALVTLTLLGILALSLSVALFVSDVNARVGDLEDVVTLASPVSAYEPVDADDVEVRAVPRRWLPDGALSDVSEVLGRVPASDLPAGTYAQRGMFVDRPGTQTGRREVTVLVDAGPDVDGHVRPGDHVDVLVTHEIGNGPTARGAEVWVPDVLVVAVGEPRDVPRRPSAGLAATPTPVVGRPSTGGPDLAGDPYPGTPAGRTVPVTFALPVSQALRLVYAERYATTIRLAVRGHGDTDPVPAEDRSFVGAVPGTPERGTETSPTVTTRRTPVRPQATRRPVATGKATVTTRRVAR